MRITFHYFEGKEIINTFIGCYEPNGWYTGFYSTSEGTFDIGIYSHTAKDALENLQAFLRNHAERAPESDHDFYKRCYPNTYKDYCKRNNA